MKYTIEGFNQEVLVSYGLNGTDAIILRYIVDFWHSDKMVKVINPADGKEYLWIKYSAVIEALPCIEITNKISLAKRFKKYTSCGLMKHYWCKEGGSFSCYRFTEKYTPLTESYKGVQSKSKTPLYPQVRPKDSSINHYSINENSKKPDSIESLSFYCPYCFKENKKVYNNGVGIHCINCGDGIKFHREYNEQQFINLCKSMHKNYKYYSLAELLYKEHLKNDDKFLYGKDLVSTFLRWGGDIRLLCEKDNRDRELVKKVIIWCQSAGNFWIPNILSGKKLREKFSTLYSQYVRSTNQENKLNGYRESAQEIIKFLNEKAGTSFDINNDAILNFPAVILRGGNTKEDCLQVVDIMTSNWKRDPKFKQNLRPSVLFRPGKFTEYLTTWKKVKWVTYDDGETWEKEEIE